MRRTFRFAELVAGRLLCAWLAGAGVTAPALAADRPVSEVVPLGRELVGAWRLVTIEVSGPHGVIPDPFYQADSVGTILYDASGWMSVQIAAPHRLKFAAPVARGQRDAGLAVAAFDTYYAYFGSWSVEEATARVTHHVVASLIPAETGLNYTQKITISGDLLTFTGQDTISGQPVVRTKVWQRIPDRR